VATYEYRCETHGVVNVSQPIGTAQPKSPCPVCHQDATRVFSVPMLSFAPRDVMAAIDRAERTSD
jgi:putative FmdB family regulatory protein